jgi:outer membrane protein assembly factor BamB
VIRPAALLLLLAAGPAAGSGTWSVEDSSEVATRLEEAARLLRRGLREKAVPLLQEVLDGWPDHVVADPKDPLRFEGAREAVLRILREAAPETRKAYEEFAAGRVEEALARAGRTGNPAALEKDALRYSAAGAPGARLLLAAADLRLARGEPGPAAASLRVLLREHADSPAAGPAVAARLARALARTGDRAGILDLRASFEKRSGEKVRTGEGEETLGSILEAALAAAGPPPRPSDTTTLGGGPDRRGAGVPMEPLGAPRWSQANGRFGWTQKDYDQMQREPPVNESIHRARPVTAALVDGVLYYHWSLDVVARDLYTGRERWRHRAPPVPRIEKARTHGSLLACPAVADGVVYAPLQVWPEGEIPRDIRFAEVDIIPHIPVRRLHAFDAATGAVLWSHRDADRFGPLLRGPLRLLNLTSPPLVLGDVVVAAGASAVQGAGFDSWCIAADRRTGEIRWATRLGRGQQELNLFGRKVKEIPCAAVASDGRRLFVQTNMGFVSCLDASTGLTLWARGYRQTEIPLYDNLWTTPERAFTFTGSPPVAAGGLVLAAPADGDMLLALDAATGELRWASPCRDGRGWDSPHMFRLLGADDERAYVAGRPTVRAFDLRSGKLAWEFPFPAFARGEASGGRGVIAGDRLFVPSDRAVYVLDTRAKGALVRVDPFTAAGGAPEGGNLVVGEGASALVRLDAVEAFFREEDVRVRAQALLRDRPGNLDALLEASRIYLAAERPADALPLLEQALRVAESLPPGERDARRREVRTSLSAVRERAAAALVAEGKAAEARGAFAAAAELAPDSASAAGVLLRGAKAMAELSPARLDHTAGLLAILVREHGDAVLEGESQLLADEAGRCTAASYALWNLAAWQAAEGDPGRSVEAAQGILERPATDLLFGRPARREARAFLDDLIRAHGPACYAPFEKRAGEALEAARRAGSAAALADVAERWPNSRAAVRAGIEEARLRLAAGDAGGVVVSLRRLVAGDLEESEAAEAHWLLAEGLARSGRAASARATLQKLARLHADVPVTVGEDRVRAADAVARRLQAADMKAPPPPAPGLPAESPWRELWSRSTAPGEAGVLIDVPGDPLPGGKALFVRGSRLDAFDAATGRSSWTATGPAFRGMATSVGGVLVFAEDDTAVGIDPATGDELWKTSLSGQALGAVAVDSVIAILVGDGTDPEGGRIEALDPATGDGAWSVLVPGGASRLHARGATAVLDGTGTGAPVLRVVDGAGTLRPFFVPLRRGPETPGELVPVRDGPLVLRKEFSLEAYDPEKGSRLWAWAGPAKARIFNAAAGGGVAAVLDEKGDLRGLTLDRGIEAWTSAAGRGRLFDPLATTLRAEGTQIFAVTVDATNRGAVALEARAAATGQVRWSAPITATTAYVEVIPAGGTILVKYLGAGTGPSGTVVLAAADGREIDRFVDREGRLGGEGFDASAVGGVLVLANERIVIARGR